MAWWDIIKNKEFNRLTDFVSIVREHLEPDEGAKVLSDWNKFGDLDAAILNEIRRMEQHLAILRNNLSPKLKTDMEAYVEKLQNLIG